MALKISTKQDWQALARLHAPENINLLGIFKAELADIDKSLRSAADTVQLHRLQGKAKLLEDFLEAVEKAPTVLAGL